MSIDVWISGTSDESLSRNQFRNRKRLTRALPLECKLLVTKVAAEYANCTERRAWREIAKLLPRSRA